MWVKAAQKIYHYTQDYNHFQTILNLGKVVKTKSLCLAVYTSIQCEKSLNFSDLIAENLYDTIEYLFILLLIDDILSVNIIIPII